MNESDIKFLTPDPGGSSFELAQGTVVIAGNSLRLSGFEGARSLSLAPGWSYDLTGVVGGANQLHLCGESTNHRVSVDGEVMTLSHNALGTVVLLQAGRSPYSVVFEDGVVRTGDLWRSVTQTAALSKLAGEFGAADSAAVASHVRPGRDAAFGKGGAHVLPDGAVLRAAGADRMETVYGSGGSSPICLEGAFAEYGFASQGAVVSLGRRYRGQFEGIYLAGTAQLVFADGHVSADALRHALQPASGSAVSSDGAQPAGENPKATSVALSIDPVTASCSDSWFGDLSARGMLSGLCVGQVIEAAVSFGQVVHVSGIPRVQLRIGGLDRIAHYSGISGSDTLRFVYVVTEDDVLEASLGAVTVSAAQVDRLDVNIEVGDVLPDEVDGQPVTGLPFSGEMDPTGDGKPQPNAPAMRKRHRILQERAGFRVRVDVDLDELEQADDSLCH